MRSTGTGATTTAFARKAAWRWIAHAVASSVHAAVPGVLAFALLAPFLGALPASPQQPPSSCGMSCSRTSHCCCHPESSIENDGVPGWTAASACSQNCCQRIRLPVSSGTTLPAGRMRIGFAQQSVSHQVDLNTSPLSAGSEFALFERPPPSQS